MARRRHEGPVGIPFGAGLLAALLAAGCGENQPVVQPPPEAPPKVVMPADPEPNKSEGPLLPAPEPAGKAAAAQKAETVTAATDNKQPAGPASDGQAPKGMQASPPSQSQQLIEQIDDIGDRGAGAADSLPILKEALGDASPEVRWHAARSLGLVGKDAVPCIADLVGRLADEEPLVVAQVATAIGRIKEDDIAPGGRPSGKPVSDSYAMALEALVKTVSHPDPRVRRAAILAIKRLHPDRAVLADLLGSMLADRELPVVMAALRSIADVGEPAVPFLAESLGRPAARYWASVALAEMGPRAAEAADELVAAMPEADPVEQMQMLLALAAIGEPAAKSAGSLVEMLENDSHVSQALRIPLVYALGQMRIEGAHEPLGRLLDSKDSILAATAAWARARIHPDQAEEVAIAVDRLLEGVRSPDPVVRQGTLSALADLSEEVTQEQAGRLAKEFGRALADGEVDVRMTGAESLARLGAAAVPELLAALGDPHRRLIAIDVLGSLGAAAKDAVPALVRLLDDPDATIRGDAAFALGGIGPDAVEAVPALIRILEAAVAALGERPPGGADGDGRPDQADDAGPSHRPARYTAAYALGRIGPPARAAVSVLDGLVKSGDPLLATVGVWSALQIEPENASLRTQAVPLLTKALLDEHDLVRLEAAVALGEIGKASRETLEMLELVAEDDPVPTVRSAAAEALAKLRGESGGAG
jgi:HEAT repeat protein